MSYRQGVPISGLNWEEVQGYAETRVTRSLISYVSSVEDCQSVIRSSLQKNIAICPRGAGYTYGDMILNDGHLILDTSRMDKIVSWDADTGRIVVQPGVRIADVLCISLPMNWTLQSCPGGPGVTIGGAVSNNVHGKDAWKNGNFGNQVVELKLLTAEENIVTINKNTDPRLFLAVIGGMGLLGIIIEVTLQLRKIPSAYVEVTSKSARNIKELLELLEDAKSESDFSVAWVDAFSSGANLGRGYVTQARWTDSATPVNQQRLVESLATPTRLMQVVPARPVWKMLRPVFGPTTIRIANMAHYFLASQQKAKKQTMLFAEYNFMHSKIPDWKHIYRPYGFLEFQPIIPRAAGIDAVAEVFKLCQTFDSQSLLCGVKVHRSDEFMLSYSGDGYSIGIDLQLRGRDRRRIEAFAGELFGFTLACGGKTFLAKDELLPKDIFQNMYPQYQEFQKIKNTMDPNCAFVSDMYRRLFD